MCGRYVQMKRRRDYERYLQARARGLEDDRPTWNLPPSASSLVARQDGDGVVLARLNWGFESAGAGGPRLVSNARIETVSQKAMFRDSWKIGRCIIPSEGWYEWRRQDGPKQPFFFRLPDDEPVLLAGLWRNGRFVILTAETYGALRQVHHRRPVALDLATAQGWLKDTAGALPPEALIAAQIAEDVFEAVPVSQQVNSTRNDGPKLIEPANPVEVQPRLFG
jgi:putative SOS response-associated peptidase YedK